MFFKCFYSDKMRENKISISAGESIKFPFMHVFPYYFSVLSVLDLMLIRNQPIFPKWVPYRQSYLKLNPVNG